MSGYTKLDSSLIHSSVWRAPRHVKILWITMLAMKDRDGVVEAAVPGLAGAADLTICEVEAALKVLTSPDPYSRTKTEKGRRLRKTDGGWFVINHDVYNERSSANDYKAKGAARAQRFRDRAAARNATEERALKGAVDEGSESPPLDSKRNVTRVASNVTAHRSNVTDSNENVTRNASSHKITPSDPDPDPDPDLKNQDSAPLALVSPGAGRRAKTRPGKVSDEEALAWSTWCEAIGKCDPARPPSAANLAAMRKALASHDVATVCDAFRGAALSAHHMADAAYRQPASILRLSDARIEGHAGRWRERGTGAAASDQPKSREQREREHAEREATMQRELDEVLAKRSAAVSR